MKKYVLMSWLFFFLFTFTSCKKNNISPQKTMNTCETIGTTNTCETIDTNNTTPSRYIYIPFSESPKVYDILNDNSIDKSFFDECKNVVSTSDMMYLYQKYLDVWQNELDIVVDKIEKNLSKDKLEEFETSQKAWELFYNTNPNIAVDMYTFKMGSGSIVHEIYGNMALNMKRYRTLELAEYCYLLTGEFEFEFDQ